MRDEGVWDEGRWTRDEGNEAQGHQKWVKTAQPTMAGMILCPDLERSEIVMLRPPARTGAETQEG